MEITLKVYYDYASSICYIGYRVLERLSKELSVQWRWKGVEIFPGGNSAWSDPRNRQRMTAKVQRIAEETEVELKLPRHWIDCFLIGAHPYETMKLHLERYFLVLSRQRDKTA